MSETLEFRTAACSDYERLLEECKTALMAWKTRREEIFQFGPRGRAAGDVLQRLQAEYARAYNRLERHAKNCAACRFKEEYGKKDQPSSIPSSTRKEATA